MRAKARVTAAEVPFSGAAGSIRLIKHLRTSELEGVSEIVWISFYEAYRILLKQVLKLIENICTASTMCRTLFEMLNTY